MEGGPAADHRRLARRPEFKFRLNDPIQLVGPASLVGNSRETFHKSGTDGSNPVPSSGESTNHRFLGGGAASAAQPSKPQPVQTVPQPGSMEWFEAQKKKG